MKKVLSVFLALLFAMQLGISAFAGFNAPRLSREEWDELYASLCDENELPMLCVGADETQVSLVWHSDKEAATPEVRLAKNASMVNADTFKGITTEAENDYQLVCRVNIDGLEENTTYYYQWNTGNGWSAPCKYETKSFTSHKALVIGDIQIGGQSEDSQVQSDVGYNWNNVLAEALEKNPDVSYLVSPGDNTSTGKTADEWQTLLMPEALRGLPMALAIGNHDKKGFAYNYYTNMPNEFYGKYFEGLDRDFWFRHGDVLYLFFDATSADAHDHMAMAKEAVELNKDAKWRIGIMHQALFGPGYSGLDPETQLLLNAVFTPIFDTFDLDLVLTGHSHLQGRSHFMTESMVVGRAKSGETYKNPKGIVYLNTNAVCDHGSFSGSMPYIAYEFSENDVTTYTTLEFEGDTMKIETRRGDNSELLDSLTIEKTKEQKDGMLLKRFQRFLYKVVEFLGLVYMRVDAIVVKIRGGHF